MLFEISLLVQSRKFVQSRKRKTDLGPSRAQIPRSCQELFYFFFFSTSTHICVVTKPHRFSFFFSPELEYFLAFFTTSTKHWSNEGGLLLMDNSFLMRNPQGWCWRMHKIQVKTQWSAKDSERTKSIQKAISLLGSFCCFFVRFFSWVRLEGRPHFPIILWADPWPRSSGVPAAGRPEASRRLPPPCQVPLRHREYACGRGPFLWTLVWHIIAESHRCQKKFQLRWKVLPNLRPCGISLIVAVAVKFQILLLSDRGRGVSSGCVLRVQAPAHELVGDGLCRGRD